MQVTQTLSEGLKQEFQVVLPAADLAEKLEAQLKEMQATAQIKGFRPGKAPVSHLRKLYGRGLMGDVLQDAVNDANRKIVDDNKLRIAIEPAINFPGGQDDVEKVLQVQGDFSYTVTFETLPTIVLGAFDDIAIERLVSSVTDADVNKSLEQLAERTREFEAKAEGAVGEKGDKLTIDFTGKLDGVTFEGGSGGDVDLLLGSGSFIPGFEEQLEGVAAGGQKLVKVRFPDDYSAKHLAGRDAEFDVTVKKIESPKPIELDDALAKKYGFETLDELHAAVRGNIESDFARVSRAKMKRALLDALDARYKFDLPPRLVDQEFGSIWTQLETERNRGGGPLTEEGKTEDEVRAEYRAIAERRVRLGLLLAEIGQQANVQVDDKDVSEALIAKARQFPGQEKQVWDYYRNNEQALAQLRAPIYEERVIDHLAAVIKITDKPVTREELLANAEEDEADDAE
jgi:trigger factor